MHPSQDHAIEQLAQQCRGDVFLPGAEGYDEARLGFNRWFVHLPGIVVSAECAEDVSAAVRFASAQGLGVAVQGVGHGPMLLADAETLLVDTRRLDAVSIDPEARTATFGAGVSGGAVLKAAQAHGLAPLPGTSGTVGAVGYSLGGGFGWLARRFGLAVDRIRELRVVLADGGIVTASGQERPELFWALCGSGGSAFGIVVEMTVELVEVDEVYAGSLFYPIEQAGEVFARYREWASTSPVELSSAFLVARFPSLPIVPEPLRGRGFVIVRGCWAGERGASLAGGEALVDLWRAWREPALDAWRPMRYAEQSMISMDPVDPMPAVATGGWLGEIDERVVDGLLAAVAPGAGPSPVLVAGIRHAGGAVRTPNHAVCYTAREGEWLFEAVGVVPDEAAMADCTARFGALASALSELRPPQPGYLNFGDGEEKAHAAAAIFDPATRARLVELKRTFDPSNLFRLGLQLG
ncbi:Mitomycin radical oxidase [Pseudoclavibacter triregionum]|nr:Mitomycin radical oxidase [Pseudoclavibacter triregionum]